MKKTVYNKQNVKRRKILLAIIVLAVVLGGGVYLGMVVQQMIIIAGLVEFGESLEGTNIEVNVDLNETKLIEGFKESLIPVLNQTLKTAQMNENAKK